LSRSPARIWSVCGSREIKRRRPSSSFTKAWARWHCGEIFHAGSRKRRGLLVTLPALLDKLDIAHPMLIGHSDGASIALIHAGAQVRPVRALVALAPHVFVEDVSIASIQRAKQAYESTSLREKLARYHDQVDSAFFGWNDIWLAPEFRQWNIEPCLHRIRCPVLLIQGRDDEYGTLAQLDAIERQIAAPVERIVLADCGHSPHRDQPQPTLAAITGFVSRLLSEEGRAHS